MLAILLLALGITTPSARGDATHETHEVPGVSAQCAEAQSFLKENDAAMTRMMADMMISPSGDVDRDFAAMMIAHHQGAIDMAKSFLRYGSNEQLLRLAQEIIITQQQEIDVMRRAADAPPSSSSDQAHHCSPH